MNATYIYVIIFFCIAYLILTDQSVAKAFYILVQISKIQYEKTKWWILYNPANPLVKYLMWRNAMKIAKDLQDELKNK